MLSDSVATNRSVDSSSDDENNTGRMVNSRFNKNRAHEQDDDSAKELRKLFPMPVLRHDQGRNDGHNSSDAYPMPYQQQQPQYSTEIMVPDDFTYVSELTSPEEGYPTEMSAQSLTSKNLRAMEAGMGMGQLPPQQMQGVSNNPTPKTFPYHSRDDDDDDADGNMGGGGASVPVNKFAEDFSYDGEEETKPRGKLFCILLIVAAVLVICAAAGIGVGLSVSNNNNNAANEANQLPSGPPVEEGVPTPAPTNGEGTIAPTISSTVLTGTPTPSPVTAPTSGVVETENPVETPVAAPTAPPATPESTPAPTAAATQPDPTPTTPESTPAPTAAATQPDPTPTPAPVPAPTAGGSSGGDCVDSIKAVESCYPAGSPITVQFNVCEADPSGLDWIGIYSADSPLDASNLGEPRYWQSSCRTSECRREPYSGQMTIQVTDLRVRTYQVFLVKSEEDAEPYSAFATGNTFEVSSSC